jgi:hypothetical protein
MSRRDHDRSTSRSLDKRPRAHEDVGTASAGVDRPRDGHAHLQQAAQARIPIAGQVLTLLQTMLAAQQRILAWLVLILMV